MLAAALAFGIASARWDGFTLLSWWRDCHSGVVRWQADMARIQDTQNTNDTNKSNTNKQVALTFDDGPNPRYTPAILDILQRHHIRATFFVEGRFVRAHPELARRIIAQGHVIGNHTETHPYLNRMPPSIVNEEIDNCDATLRSTLGLRTYLFRPPRGLWNPVIYEAAQTRGDHLILWTVGVEHHDVPTPRQMADRALRLIEAGGILLLHDGGSAPRDTTVAALPLLLDGLQAEGYTCVTIPQLLHIRGNEDTGLNHGGHGEHGERQGGDLPRMTRMKQRYADTNTR